MDYVKDISYHALLRVRRKYILNILHIFIDYFCRSQMQVATGLLYTKMPVAALDFLAALTQFLFFFSPGCVFLLQTTLTHQNTS